MAKKTTEKKTEKAPAKAKAAKAEAPIAAASAAALPWLSRLQHKPGARKRRTRIGLGEGSGHGQTATRGQKGQRSRSGDGKQVGFEGGQTPLLRRIPKRGFSHASWDKSYHVVNVGELNGFDDGATVDAESLKAKGLANGPADGVRILGNGELTKKLVVKAHHFSKSAAQKIADKGGSTEVIPQPKKPVRNKMKPPKPKK